jgi:hypothetical protein
MTNEPQGEEWKIRGAKQLRGTAAFTYCTYGLERKTPTNQARLCNIQGN